MTVEAIRDQCRGALIPYLEKALVYLPPMEHPDVIDLGCGTGVPTLALARHFDGKIDAVDNDRAALDWLNLKARKLSLTHRIETIERSVLELDVPQGQYDLVVAEGLLNIIGFETGIGVITKLMKANRFAIIHDEYAHHEAKIKLFEHYHLQLLGTEVLDETVWWEDYYKSLQQQIETHTHPEFFREDLKQISDYERNPEKFRSIYYVLQKGGT